MKILIIILEGDSVSGLCMKNVITELVNRGHRVDVITYDNSKYQDMPIVKNYPIKSKFFLRNNKTQKAYAIQCAITSLFIWPWNSPLFSYRLFLLIKKVQRKNKYEIIIPCYTQIDALLATYFLKKEEPHLKIVPYFLDALSGGPTPRLLSTNKKILKGLWWERKLLEKMDSIIMMKSSEQHQVKYNSYTSYFNRIKFYDIPMLTKPEYVERSQSENTNIIRMVYVGSMPLSVRNPYYGLNLLKKCGEISIKIVGPIPDSKKYIKFLENMQNIEITGKTDHENAIRFINNADVLLNFGNNIPEMVPSKIFEYMSYGKPIISFAPIKNDSSIPYLIKYPNACLVYEEDLDEYNINKIKQFLKNEIKRKISYAQIKEIYKLNTPEYVCDFLEQVVQGKNDK